MSAITPDSSACSCPQSWAPQLAIDKQHQFGADAWHGAQVRNGFVPILPERPEPLRQPIVVTCARLHDTRH